MSTQLPEWQRTIEEKPRPAREQKDVLAITPNTEIVVYQTELAGGSLRSYHTPCHRDWPGGGNDEDRRNATLRFALAEIEQALPIIRAMVEQITEVREVLEKVE